MSLTPINTDTNRSKCVLDLITFSSFKKYDGLSNPFRNDHWLDYSGKSKIPVKTVNNRKGRKYEFVRILNTSLNGFFCTITNEYNSDLHSLPVH